MLRILLVRFWPVWIPLLVWLIWYFGWGRKKQKAKGLAAWEQRLWLWATLLSLGLLAACIILLGVSEPAVEGTYVPAHVHDGELVPGHIVKDEKAPQ
jgi:hypothetical protein